MNIENIGIQRSNQNFLPGEYAVTIIRYKEVSGGIVSNFFDVTIVWKLKNKFENMVSIDKLQ